MKRALVSVSLFLLVGGCVQRVEIVWPKEPLRVEIVNPGALAAAAVDGGAAPDPAESPVDKPPEPTRAKLAGKPVKLAGSGTLAWVDYTAGNYGSGLIVYKVDAAGDDPCSAGGSREEVWRMEGGQHWDAQLEVDANKVLCVESSYADGEVAWLVR